MDKNIDMKLLKDEDIQFDNNHKMNDDENKAINEKYE